MDPFPEEHELIWLFEAEPTLADPDVVWFYNWVRFVTERGRDNVSFEVEPSGKLVRFSWSRDGAELTSAEIYGVHGLAVLKEKAGEGLAMQLDQNDSVVLWLKPSVRLEWHLEPKYFAKDS